MSYEEEWETHPSYGTVQFNRIGHGGKCRLFGSSITNHQHTIALYIRTAKRSHRYHEDTIYGQDTLIEVELSSAQFAELLTTMNVGTGVPCTIRRMRDIDIPEPPDTKVEIDRVQDSFKKEIKALTDSLSQKRELLASILEKKTIGKEDKKTILSLADRIINELTSNIPFIIDQFNEATGRVISTAKSEVDAFITGIVVSAGLKHLESLKEEVKQLVAPKENVDG